MLAVALVLRAAYVFAVHRIGAEPASDSISYDVIAWNLASDRGFQLMRDTTLYPTAKAPLLPWLVSLVYRVTGHVYFASLLLQCVIGAFVPVLVRSLGRTMFGTHVGRIAARTIAANRLSVSR